MALILPASAVIRLSRGDFGPSCFADVDRVARSQASYLVPAIGRLSGLAAHLVGVSPAGSMIHASLWESDADAQQLSSVPELNTRELRQLGSSNV